MSLQDWQRDGHLKTHITSRKEIQQIMAVYRRDMEDAQMEGLSTDRKFTIAYDAALMAARAALAASGYRTSGEANHYWTIRSLEFTVNAGSDTVKKLDTYRRKRNISNYEMVGMVSEADAVDVLELASALHDRVVKWLEGNFPGLV